MGIIGVSHDHLAKHHVGAVATEQKFQPEIPVLVDEQDDVICRLHDLLDALEVRASSVLSPAPAVGSNDEASTSPLQNTELGIRLRNSISRTHYAVNRLEEIISRIHL